MTIPPDSIKVGQCYLTDANTVRRVVRIMPNGQIQFEHRTGAGKGAGWKAGMLDPRSFASMVQREVACD